MNVAFGMNLGAFSRVGSSQAQVNQQVAVAGGSAAIHAQDRLVRDSHRSASLRMVGNRVGQRRVLDKAGVTKVASAKKR